MELSHIDQNGDAVMVDISEKSETCRTALCEGFVEMKPETLAIIRKGEAKKGDVIAVARIAGIMAAKKTSELIPLCHNILLDSINVDIDFDENDSDGKTNRLVIRAQARSTGKTGVEMEAFTAVSVACLTIYDMCKAVDRGMIISGIRLLEKTGGKSDYQGGL
ncbi:MAG: cyclic pyranopterin monophosphate synthase MoaC [Saccharofermentanales bacterium]